MSDACGGVERGEDRWRNLRIGAIFILLLTSLCGTLAPILAKRAWRIPAPAFDFVKYFGSGVIIATAFIHLLAPAYDALTSECLSDIWHSYPFAPAYAMISVFGLFLVELFAFRAGNRMVERTGLVYDVHAGPTSHTHHEGANTKNPIHDIETAPAGKPEGGSSDVHVHKEGDLMLPDDEGYETDPRLIAAQIIGVAVLEFGIVLHSIIIGLTLAVDDSFRTLFVVIVFHQMFEGLGLGSRLAFLKLAPHLSWVPYAASILYSAMTPIGMAIGLGIRTTYNPSSTTASLVQGTLDALSAGVLLYTGLVELLAHEFLFNPQTRDASTLKILYACACMITGAGIMALLGRWA